MKCFLVVSLIYIALVAIDGGALASPTDGESTDHTRTCPMLHDKPDQDEASRQSELIQNVIKCLEGNKTMAQMDEMKNFTDIYQFFYFYCQELDSRTTCLNTSVTLAEQCVNHTNHMAVEIHKGVFKSVLDVGCENGGGIFSELVHGFNSIEGEDVVHDCINTLLETKALQSRSSTERFMAIYTHHQDYKNCVLGKLENKGDDFKNLVGSIIDDIVKDLLCIHPQDNVLVKCSSI